MNYIYQGPISNIVFNNTIKNLTDKAKPNSESFSSYQNWYQKLLIDGLDPILPVESISPSANHVGGMPSVFINKQQMKDLTNVLLQRV